MFFQFVHGADGRIEPESLRDPVHGGRLDTGLRQPRIAEDRHRIALEMDVALPEHQHSVRAVECQVHVVGDHHAAVAPAPRIPDEVDENAGPFGVLPTGRFVQHEDRTTHGDDRRDGDPLAPRQESS